MQRLPIPELPAERFDVHAVLGSGASGHVLDAYDRLRRTRVAVKTLAQRSGAEADALRREFRLAQDLAHPNLAQLGEFLPLRDGFCFTMELVEGTDFVSWVTEDATRLRPALAQLARGVRALHAAGVIHRDIKPSNVLVARDGRVVLLDFGIAEMADATGRLDEASLGTPHYASPEQCAGERSGGEADWYAVGALLFHALAGRPPFVGGTFEVIGAKVSQTAPSVISLAPSTPPDLAKLCDALLHQDPKARPDAEAIARALGDECTVEPISSDVFVGRSDELARLRGLLTDARREGLRCIVLRGQSGVGKSRLLRAFAESRTLTGDRLVVLRGRCYERELVAYKAFIGIVDDLLDRLRKEPSLDEATRNDLVEVAALFPQVRQRLEEHIPAQAFEAIETRENARERRRVAIDAFLRLVHAFARKKPLVLLIDDVQWIDEDSVDLLQALLASETKPPVLVILSERVAATSDGPSPLDAQLPPGIPVLALEPLSPSETGMLAASLLADSSVPASVLEQAVKDSGGHPLLLDELLRSGAQAPSSSEPLRLDDVLRARADTLPPDARRLLQAICLAGTPLDQAAAGMAAGIDMQSLLHLLGLLRGGRFIRAGLRVASEVEPNHDRVREAIVVGMSEGERKALHRSLAVVFEGADDARAEAIAMHWIAAGEEGKGVGYLRLGAEQARATLAFTRAAELLRTALHLSPPEERLALRRRIVDSLTSAGRESEAADERLALANETNPDEAAIERQRAAEQLLRCGRHAEGLAVLRDALAKTRFYYPESTALLVLLLIFMRFRLALRGVELTSAPRADALTVARADTARSAASGLALSDTVRGAYFQTWALLEALASGDLARVQYALCMEICFLATGAERNLARTARYLEAAEGLAERINTPGARAMVSCGRGYRAYFAGQWLAAREELAKAESMLRNRCPTLVFEANAMRYNLYRTLAFLGDYREFRARVPAAIADAVERGDRLAEMNFRSIGSSQLALADDDAPRARAELDAAATGLIEGRFHVQHFAHTVAAVGLELYEAQPREAARRLAVARRAMQGSLLGRIESLRITLLDVEARVALALVAADSTPERRAELERAVGRLGRAKPSWAKALATLRRAGALEADGAHDSATQYLEAARLLDAEGMLLYAASARYRAASLLDGAEGETLRDLAVVAMRRQGIRNVARFVHFHAPSPGSRVVVPNA